MRGQTGASESLMFPFIRPGLTILRGFDYEPNTQQLLHKKWATSDKWTTHESCVQSVLHH